MDPAYYAEIAGKLRGLLMRLEVRIASEAVTEVAEAIDHNELGVALEWIAFALSEDEQPLSADELAGMLALVDRMEMDDRVPRALALCPKR
jgi:hypothetical protein